ncbi:Ig-like domain-containing protein [Pseudoalteromonas peptidolytica]|uniref:Big-1 domain-containing protein n=1 Tax=Pseudoalteromonas peptidolytica F12-50-A1 TaxID=1315280 RepID=A0A8I0MVU0_9GAMM|nr:hypothetical protein [Pseudoalteromonas peptidolytica]MBE0346809.1 hypothetical protein [Pseudoalteromonas peptidolytica F12-50-A1]NLR13714.1 hypothetical protein [Pseudoalteromonas peptidolytica]GEK08645.1 hypothetical protein PPE03_08940 [Pseudoalteromonas peptidolytica]
MPLMRYFGLLIIAFLLTACGGGGSIQKDTDNGNGDGSDGTYAITLSGSDSDGNTANTLSSTSPLIITATLTKDGSALANSRVVFESDEFAVMEPSSGSVLTDTEGKASVTLKVTNVVGAGRITASYEQGSNAVSKTFDFTSQGGGDNSDNTASGKLEVMLLSQCPVGWDTNRDQAMIDPIAAGCTRVNQVSSNETADIFIKLTSSQTSDAIANALISAETTLGTILPATGTALTDNFGIAILKFQPGNQGGAGTITVNSPDYIDVTQAINFNVGVAQLNVSIDNGLVDGDGVQQQLSAGGSTVITVTLKDQNGALINSAFEVAFSSPCSSATPALAELDESVNTSNGIARSTYRAKGCQGEDRISVTIQNGSSPINKETTIEIDSALAQAVQFLPEEEGFNQFIALPPGEGGLPTQSVVSFKLVDEDNLAIPRARVDFRLSDEQGLASLTQITGNTNANGIVRTTVKSGIVPGPLVVSACYIPEESYVNLPDGDAITCWTDIAKACNDTDATNDDVRCPTGVMHTIPLSEQIFGVSSGLILSSGVTDQDTFDASPTTFNTNSLNHSGVTTDIRLFFGDQFNQFNADGVAATVIAEAGAIGSLDSPDTYDCRTNQASCTVVWRSQGDRPFYDYRWGNRIGDIDGNSNTYEGVAPKLAATLSNSQKAEPSNWNCDPYFGSPAPCIEGMLRQRDASITDGETTALRRVVVGGRVSVLAFVKGQENFRDEQSSDGIERRNGRFDIGEYRQEYDLTEAFLDTNENGRFDKEDCDVAANSGPCSPTGTKNGGHDDWWIDANNNGLFDFDTDGNGTFEGDGRYNGLLCSEAAENAGECTRELVNVYRQFELVMSGDVPYVRFTVFQSLTDSGTCANSNGLVLETSDQDGYCDIAEVDFTVSDSPASVPITIFFSDEFGNPLPAGTDVEISTNNGELTGGTITRVVSNSGKAIPGEIEVILVPETEPNNKFEGLLNIKFTFPALGDDDSDRKVRNKGIKVRDAG